MKRLTILLSLLILFLASKPGIDLVRSQTSSSNSCCSGQCKLFSDEKTPLKSEQKNDDCTGKSCNPFQSCCIWVQHTMARSVQKTLKSDIATKQNFTYKPVFTAHFIADFWQPPQIA